MVAVRGPLQDMGQLQGGESSGTGQHGVLAFVLVLVGAVTGGQQAQQLQDGGQGGQAVAAVLAEGVVDVA